MRFIRMKIKSLVIEDATILQELHAQTQELSSSKFSLTVTLPLPDIYKRAISNQYIKLNNYTVVAENEFEFTSLSLYNFMVSEETFNGLSASNLKVGLDDMNISGKFQMNKLLMAPNFKLAVQIPLTKTVVIESKEAGKSAQEKKEEQLKAKKGRKTQADLKKAQAQREKDNKEQVIETHVGYLEVEINLQRGDTEEELERNYQIKLKHQETMRQQE